MIKDLILKTVKKVENPKKIFTARIKMDGKPLRL